MSKREFMPGNFKTESLTIDFGTDEIHDRSNEFDNLSSTTTVQTAFVTPNIKAKILKDFIIFYYTDESNLFHYALYDLNDKAQKELTFKIVEDLMDMLNVLEVI